jgi:hypothetical protein
VFLIFLLNFGSLYSVFKNKYTAELHTNALIFEIPKTEVIGRGEGGVDRQCYVRKVFVIHLQVHTMSDPKRSHQTGVKAEPSFHSLFKFHVGGIWQESFYFRSETVLRAE